MATVNFNITDEEYDSVIRIYSSDDGYIRYIDFINDTVKYY